MVKDWCPLLELICLARTLLPKYGKQIVAVLAALIVGCFVLSNWPFALPSELEQAAGLDMDMACSSCWGSWQKIRLQELEPPVDDQQAHLAWYDSENCHWTIQCTTSGICTILSLKIKGSVAAFQNHWPKHWLRGSLVGEGTQMVAEGNFTLGQACKLDYE